MTSLKYWWRYLWSRFQNEWRQVAREQVSEMYPREDVTFEIHEEEMA